MVGALITGLAHLITSLPAGAWDHAHGDSANTGFARVDTAPASKPQQTVQVGPLAPGAGPVIGPNGTVYVANMTGIASPAIGPMGHVYGVMHAPDHTDSLLVWPPPPRRLSGGLLGSACDPELVHP
jgi:hypothetical protein